MIPHCHTGKHKHHLYKPYLWGHAYDQVCELCGFEAALELGKHILCDCCAEDWHQYYGTKSLAISLGRGWKKNWEAEFQKFREARPGLSDSRALFTRRGTEDAGQVASIADIEGLIHHPG